MYVLQCAPKSKRPADSATTWLKHMHGALSYPETPRVGPVVLYSTALRVPGIFLRQNRQMLRALIDAGIVYLFCGGNVPMRLAQFDTLLAKLDAEDNRVDTPITVVVDKKEEVPEPMLRPVHEILGITPEAVEALLVSETPPVPVEQPAPVPPEAPAPKAPVPPEAPIAPVVDRKTLPGPKSKYQVMAKDKLLHVLRGVTDEPLDGLKRPELLKKIESFLEV